MPWETASRNLNYFFLMFDRSEVYGPMQVGDECFTFIEINKFKFWSTKQTNKDVHARMLIGKLYAVQMEYNSSFLDDAFPF